MTQNDTAENIDTLSQLEFDIICQVSIRNAITGEVKRKCSNVAKFDIVFHGGYSCKNKHSFACAEHLTRIMTRNCSKCDIEPADRIISCTTIKK